MTASHILMRVTLHNLKLSHIEVSSVKFTHTLIKVLRNPKKLQRTQK